MVHCLPCEREVARRSRDGGIHRPQTDEDVRPYARIQFTLLYVKFFACGSE